MSAICGIVNLDGRPVASTELRDMMARLAHRGQDGRGAWLDGPVGLGHQMLHVTPESLHETLPAQAASGHLTITADARIDNRGELFEALGIAQAERGDMPDSALILRAYGKWDEECPTHLIGDFAFAIWDSRKRELLAARDPMGTRPLYYHRGDRAFVFATEIKAILARPNLSTGLDEEIIADHLLNQASDPRRTIYRDISCLAPAHAMRVGPDADREWCHWQLDPDKGIHLNSDEEYVEAYRELLFEAVRCRLRSAFPIASKLSGGLDSSTIVCVAAPLVRERGERLTTLSWALPPGDDSPFRDERAYIDAVRDVADIDAAYVLAEGKGPMDELDRALALNDLPPRSALYMVLFDTFRAAAASGARVLLSGYGGDELATTQGEAVGISLARQGRLVDFVQFHRSRSVRRGEPPTSVLRLIMRACVQTLPWWLHHGLQVVRRRGQPDPMLHGLMSHPEFMKRTGVLDRLKASEKEHWQTFGKYAIGRLNWGHLATRSVQGSHFAGPEGVELAFPFQDRRLLEFCLAVPLEQHVGDGWGRYLVRRAGEGILPPKVQWSNDKTGAPVPDSVRRICANREEILALLERASRNGATNSYIDVERMRRKLTETFPAIVKEGIDAGQMPPGIGCYTNALGLARFLELDPRCARSQERRTPRG